MARLCPPILLAECNCGEIKIKDYQDSEPYWTNDCKTKELAEKLKLPIENCPEHGGNTEEMIGNFFCRVWYLNADEQQKLDQT